MPPAGLEPTIRGPKPRVISISPQGHTKKRANKLERINYTFKLVKNQKIS